MAKDAKLDSDIFSRRETRGYQCGNVPDFLHSCWQDLLRRW
jgi:hypothetical protein